MAAKADSSFQGATVKAAGMSRSDTERPAVSLLVKVFHKARAALLSGQQGEDEAPSATVIRPKFGLVGTTSYTISLIIGSGIFITSNSIMKYVGSWGAALMVWTASGAAAMLGALSFAELAAAYPRQGGTYISMREEIGEYPAFLYIITSILLKNPASQAVGTLAAAKQLQAAFTPCAPAISSQLLACSLLLLMTWLNSACSTLTSSLNTAITFIKIGTLVVIFSVGMSFLVAASPTLEPPFQGTARDANAWVYALYGARWSYNGWQGVPACLEEIREPQTTFPRAVTLGVGLVTLLYLATNIAFLLVLTPEQVMSSSLIVTTFTTVALGSSLAIPFSLLVFISLFGAALCTDLVSGRTCYAAARQGDLPSPLAMLHTQHNTPVPAQMVHLAISLIMVASTDRIDLLLSLVIFVATGFELLIIGSLFTLKYRTRNEVCSGFRVSVLVPVLYFIFLLFIFIASFLEGVDAKIAIPIGFLVLASLAYVVFIKKQYISPNFNQWQPWLAVLFDLQLYDKNG